MEENKRIDKLNKKISRNTRKIKNLRIRDDIIAFIPMVTLVGTVTVIYFKNCDNMLVKEFYPLMVYASLFVGGIPSMYLPTERTKNRINKYQLEIKVALDELHGYAIEEDKKRMLKK